MQYEGWVSDVRCHKDQISQVDDLLESNLLTPLNGARIVYLDGRLHETALIVAHEAVKKNIHGLDDLIKLADYVECAARFPRACTLFSLE
ncbi:hypothetical protein JHK82_050982 [Glycine max]|nr:hypothetical protein JHK86_050840 [Glycine max]KAG4936763.1 hypothetical protein JHK85_051682 [Glycine max]KAG5092204.1 hypothetical protein JHK82_050982 [Glycine max]KAG5095283.1 hypothetical protein JHK84_050871 [Glycine max]